MALGPVLHRRNEDRHHRCVVQKRAQSRHRQHQPQRGAPAAGGRAELADPAHRAGLGEAGDHHVEHRHGQHARDSKTRQCLLRRQDAGDQQQRQGPGRDNVRRDARAHEQHETEYDQAQAEPAGPTESGERHGR